MVRRSRIVSIALMVTITVLVHTQQIQVKEAETYYRIGQTFLHTGSNDDDIEAFSKAIQIKPDYWEAYKGRGCAYANRGSISGSP